MIEVNYNRCIHCNKKINDFSKKYLVEVIKDFSKFIIEKRCFCKACHKKLYEQGETND